MFQKESLKTQQPNQLPLLSYVSPKWVKLIKYLFTRQTSNYLLSIGRRETGKTDMNLLIFETLYYLGYRNFATNIKIYSSYFPIEHISNAEDLEEWAENVKGFKFYILDEYGKAFKRRSPMAKINLEIIEKLQTLRKYKLSLLTITIAEKFIDAAGLGADVLDGVFFKPQFKNPKIAIYFDNIEDLRFELNDIPRTRIRFDTWDIAPFKLKRPLEKPKFKDKDLTVLWDYAHGRTAKEIGLQTTQIIRIVKKFLKDKLEGDSYALQD